jgi:segregation and condensation protein A
MTDTPTELPLTLSVPPDPAAEAVAQGKGFSVHLDNFEGPFDLLLQLISKHKLDITEVALSQVTDDFIAHIKAMGPDWDLDQTSEFLLVAATLLDLKAARLLPQGDVEDAEDLALLEARDLLFARLLQYRAFKQIAALVNGRMAEESKRFPRAVSMEPRFASLLPEVLIGIDPAGLAALAAKAFAPKPVQELSLAHLHAPQVTVREQATVIVGRLRQHRSTTFRALVSDSPGIVTTVCRFLALLELFREGAVAFDQMTPLGELTIRWTGSDSGDIEVGDEFDAPPPKDDEDTPDSADDSPDDGSSPEDTPWIESSDQTMNWVESPRQDTDAVDSAGLDTYGVGSAAVDTDAVESATPVQPDDESAGPLVDGVDSTRLVMGDVESADPVADGLGSAQLVTDGGDSTGPVTGDDESAGLDSYGEASSGGNGADRTGASGGSDAFGVVGDDVAGGESAEVGAWGELVSAGDEDIGGYADTGPDEGGWTTGAAEDLGTPSTLEPVPDTDSARTAEPPARPEAATEQMDER